MMINRRDILLGSAAIGASSLLATPVRAQAAHEGSVVIRTTGGVFEAALKRNFFDPFTQATGIKVIPVAASAGEMLARTAAMHAAGRVEWDIISPQYDQLPIMSQFLEDLGDCSALPNVAAQGVDKTCNRYGILYLTGAEVMAYNPTAFPNRKPTSWNDFYDVKNFPGRRALANTGVPWGTLVVALLVDGVAPKDLFPLDLDRAFRRLDMIKPHISVWWRTGDQSQQLIRSGDVVMQMMWSGRAFAARRAGAAVEWNYNQAVADFGAWAILKGAPHPKAARAFLDFYMDKPEAHATFSREMGYTTSNRLAHALLSEDDKRMLVAKPETFQQIVHVDARWLEANRAAGLERWNRWIAA